MWVKLSFKHLSWAVTWPSGWSFHLTKLVKLSLYHVDEVGSRSAKCQFDWTVQQDESWKWSRKNFQLKMSCTWGSRKLLSGSLFRMFNFENVFGFSFLTFFLFSKVRSRHLFFIFVFSIQLTVHIQHKFLPITGLEPRTSRVGSDRSTNWATNDVFLVDTKRFSQIWSRCHICSKRSHCC